VYNYHFKVTSQLIAFLGVFSMVGQLASEEQYFPIHEFNGKYMDNPSGWLRWDPSAHTAEWQTPHLIIHSDLDFRLTVSEGLSAFNVLQQNGVPSRYLTFPDENHWVLNPENSLLWHAVVLDWINRYVGLPNIRAESWAKAILEEAGTTPNL
jgi:dipeptidyl aminopeptidase/acylaminoacyl peptidase